MPRILNKSEIKQFINLKKKEKNLLREKLTRTVEEENQERIRGKGFMTDGRRDKFYLDPFCKCL